MGLNRDQITAQNPWWTRPGAWEGEDPHLLRLAEQPVRLDAPLVDEADLERPGIHVLRGPRQAGKSTDLKLLIVRALAEGRPERRIVYLACDLLEGQAIGELEASVRLAKQLAAGEREPCLLLLDEVTAVPGWQTALKFLWDQGPLRDDVAYCTGSSAIEVREGAVERLPGRRGAGEDHLVLPQSFAAFARAIDDSVPRSPEASVAELVTPAGHELLRDHQVYLPALDRALSLYLGFGGLPAAVAEAASGAAEPSSGLRRVIWDSLYREAVRRGLSELALRSLLERVVRSLGSKTNWSTMAREMDVPLKGGSRTTHHSVREYIELLAAGYFLFVAYFWQSREPLGAQSHDKKVYAVDPLLLGAAIERMPGVKVPEAALVENVVGMTLLRRYEPPDRLHETFALPERLHVWQRRGTRELDFTCGPRGSLDVVEVKYQSNPKRSSVAGAARAHPGRPVVMATRDLLEPGERFTLVPVSLLLWALGSGPSREPGA